MAENNNTKMLKLALIIITIVSLVYGLAYLLIPSSLVNYSGGNPVEASWMRWSGGVIIAWAVGTLMVYSNPEKQKIFETYHALVHLLAVLGLLYGWMMQEYNGATWFIAIPTLLLLILTVLILWGRNQAKEILKIREK